MVRRVKSGVFGLDNLIQGGFVHNSVNLVTGETGTGKTILGCQFLWHGLEEGEPGLLVTLEEDPENIKEDARQFGWNFYQYEKRGLFKIIYHDPSHMSSLNSVIVGELKKMDAKRLVIDSISVIGMNLDHPAQIRTKIFGIIESLKKQTDCTTLIISEVPEGTRSLSRFGVEEYLTDSVIVLNYLGMDEKSDRSITVRKMRRTDHKTDIYPFNITNKGIVVSKTEL